MAPSFRSPRPHYGLLFQPGWDGQLLVVCTRAANGVQSVYASTYVLRADGARRPRFVCARVQPLSHRRPL